MRSSVEMTISCALKDTGGLSGKTENAGASESWMQINHLMAALREKLDQVTRKRTFSGMQICEGKSYQVTNKMLKHLQTVYLTGFQRYGKTINLLLTLQLVSRKISYILDIISVIQFSA